MSTIGMRDIQIARIVLALCLCATCCLGLAVPPTQTCWSGARTDTSIVLRPSLIDTLIVIPSSTQATLSIASNSVWSSLKINPSSASTSACDSSVNSTLAIEATPSANQSTRCDFKVTSVGHSPVTFSALICQFSVAAGSINVGGTYFSAPTSTDRFIATVSGPTTGSLVFQPLSGPGASSASVYVFNDSACYSTPPPQSTLPASGTFMFNAANTSAPLDIVLDASSLKSSALIALIGFIPVPELSCGGTAPTPSTELSVTLNSDEAVCEFALYSASSFTTSYSLAASACAVSLQRGALKIGTNSVPTDPAQLAIIQTFTAPATYTLASSQSYLLNQILPNSLAPSLPVPPSPPADSDLPVTLKPIALALIALSLDTLTLLHAFIFSRSAQGQEYSKIEKAFLLVAVSRLGLSVALELYDLFSFWSHHPSFTSLVKREVIVETQDFMFSKLCLLAFYAYEMIRRSGDESAGHVDASYYLLRDRNAKHQHNYSMESSVGDKFKRFLATYRIALLIASPILALSVFIAAFKLVTMGIITVCCMWPYVWMHMMLFAILSGLTSYTSRFDFSDGDPEALPLKAVLLPLSLIAFLNLPGLQLYNWTFSNEGYLHNMLFTNNVRPTLKAFIVESVTFVDLKGII